MSSSLLPKLFQKVKRRPQQQKQVIMIDSESDSEPVHNKSNYKRKRIIKPQQQVIMIDSDSDASNSEEDSQITLRPYQAQQQQAPKNQQQQPNRKKSRIMGPNDQQGLKDQQQQKGQQQQYQQQQGLKDQKEQKINEYKKHAEEFKRAREIKQRQQAQKLKQLEAKKSLHLINLDQNEMKHIQSKLKDISPNAYVRDAYLEDKKRLLESIKQRNFQWNRIQQNRSHSSKLHPLREINKKKTIGIYDPLLYKYCIDLSEPFEIPLTQVLEKVYGDSKQSGKSILLTKFNSQFEKTAIDYFSLYARGADSYMNYYLRHNHSWDNLPDNQFLSPKVTNRKFHQIFKKESERGIQYIEKFIEYNGIYFAQPVTLYRGTDISKLNLDFYKSTLIRGFVSTSYQQSVANEFALDKGSAMMEEWIPESESYNHQIHKSKIVHELFLKFRNKKILPDHMICCKMVLTIEPGIPMMPMDFLFDENDEFTWLENEVLLPHSLYFTVCGVQFPKEYEDNDDEFNIMLIYVLVTRKPIY